MLLIASPFVLKPGLPPAKLAYANQKVAAIPGRARPSDRAVMSKVGSRLILRVREALAAIVLVLSFVAPAAAMDISIQRLPTGFRAISAKGEIVAPGFCRKLLLQVKKSPSPQSAFQAPQTKHLSQIPQHFQYSGQRRWDTTNATCRQCSKPLPVGLLQSCLFVRDLKVQQPSHQIVISHCTDTDGIATFRSRNACFEQFQKVGVLYLGIRCLHPSALAELMLPFLCLRVS
jgi:hypothetical protein